MKNFKVYVIDARSEEVSRLVLKDLDELYEVLDDYIEGTEVSEVVVIIK